MLTSVGINNESKYVAEPPKLVKEFINFDNQLGDSFERTTCSSSPVGIVEFPWNKTPSNSYLILSPNCCAIIGIFISNIINRIFVFNMLVLYFY